MEKNEAARLSEIESLCVDAERLTTLLHMGAIFCEEGNGDPVAYVGPANDTLEVISAKLLQIRALASG